MKVKYSTTYRVVYYKQGRLDIYRTFKSYSRVYISYWFNQFNNWFCELYK
jgi:hypothetical protein